MTPTDKIQTSLLDGAIQVLRGLPSFGDYPTWWCDIIYDEQEHGGYLLDDPYRSAVLGILATLIRKLPVADIEPVWLTTEQGDEYTWEKKWQKDVEASDDNELAALYRTRDDRIDDIACHLLSALREKAYKANLEVEVRRAKRASA